MKADTDLYVAMTYDCGYPCSAPFVYSLDNDPVRLAVSRLLDEAGNPNVHAPLVDVIVGPAVVTARLGELRVEVRKGWYYDTPSDNQQSALIDKIASGVRRHRPQPVE